MTAPLFTETTENELDVLFLWNFTTLQQSALLQPASTLALLYTPANEHFGMGPVEGMICGLSVLACDSGGPTEGVVDQPPERTGWLRSPIREVWADALEEIYFLDASERGSLAQRAKHRAELVFGMAPMATELERLLIETVEMGPVDVQPMKGIAFLFAPPFGLMVAVVSRQYS